jgi:transcriptional regulator with XRE-family HTH domain
MDALAKEFVRMVGQSGWTQRKVARQLELTDGAVSHIMNGRNRPSPSVVKLFGLVLESEKGGTAVKDGAGLARKAEPWEEGLLKKLRALSPGQRGRVLTAVDAMVSALKP